MAVLKIKDPDTGVWTSIPTIKGDKGDKGDTGATGAQGPKGDKGDTGPQGVKGDTGPQGPKGDKGDTGQGLPDVTADDNGKLAGVVNGVWDTVDVKSTGGYRLIRRITIPTLEDYATDNSGVVYQIDDVGNALGFQFQTDSDGNQFGLSELIVFGVGSTSYSSQVQGSFANDWRTTASLYGGISMGLSPEFAAAGGTTYGMSTITMFADGCSYSTFQTFGGGARNPMYGSGKLNGPSADKTIKAVRFYISNLAAYGLEPGTTLTFYGR